MKKLLSVALLAGTLTGSAAETAPVQVASAEPAGADTLRSISIEETVVVGERVNHHDLTPLSVSVITGSKLTDLEVNTVSGLSAVLPNVFIPEYGSRQTRPISIRGIMSKVKGSAVGFYMDGMPRFEVSSFDADMLDVKSIEVFRGPQSTLYGRNTLGGVIHIHTYNPFEYQGTKVRVGYGNYNTYNAQASHYNQLNNQLALQVSGYYNHSDGYFKNHYLDKKADELDMAGGRFGLYWRPADRWMVRLTTTLDYLDQGGYPYAPYDAETGTLSAVSYNRPSGYSRLISNTGLMLNYQFENFSLNSQTSFEHIDDDQDIDQDFTANDTYLVTNGINNNIVSEELTLKSTTYSPFQWVGGAFFSSQAYSQQQGTQYLTKGMTQVAHFNIPLQNVAGFGQVSYNLWNGLSVTAGLRFDYEHSEQDYKRTQVLTADGSQSVLKEFKASMDQSEWIPKFNVQYTFSQQNLVYANIARGYKAGGFNASFQTDDEKTYNPEHNWNYEVGYKFMTPNRHFGGDVTLFYIDWKNQHISRTIAGLGNVIYNAGHSDSKGVELNLLARPLQGLLLQASYGYTYARFLDYKKSETVDYSGNMTPLVPRNTLFGLVSYTLTPRRVFDSITLSSNVTGVGKMYWLEDNQVSQPFYALLGAKVAFTKGITTLEFWGKNLTNTDYLSYYFVSSAKYAQDGVPTTCGVSATVQF